MDNTTVSKELSLLSIRLYLNSKEVKKGSKSISRPSFVFGHRSCLTFIHRNESNDGLINLYFRGAFKCFRVQDIIQWIQVTVQFSDVILLIGRCFNVLETLDPLVIQVNCYVLSYPVSSFLSINAHIFGFVLINSLPHFLGLCLYSTEYFLKLLLEVLG